MAQIGRLEDRHVDGLILMTNQPDDGTLAALLRTHRNVVLLDEDVPGFAGPKVFVENAQGAWQATRHLIEAGHKRIAHVGGPVGLMSTSERLDGFRRAMEESGLEPGEVVLGAYTREFGASAIEKILSGTTRPTAVFAGSDFVALGIMQKLRERGMQVPEDISLVGFDDMPFADLLAPPLTTIRQPVQDLGRRAFTALFGTLTHQSTPQTERLPTSLVERQSVVRRA